MTFCILIEPSGNMERISINLSTSPTKNETHLYIQHSSFIGAWQLNDIDIVAMHDLKSSVENKHALPPPLHNEKAFGNILLIKMDENVEPADIGEISDVFEMLHKN